MHISLVLHHLLKKNFVKKLLLMTNVVLNPFIRKFSYFFLTYQNILPPLLFICLSDAVPYHKLIRDDKIDAVAYCFDYQFYMGYQLLVVCLF